MATTWPSCIAAGAAAIGILVALLVLPSTSTAEEPEARPVPAEVEPQAA